MTEYRDPITGYLVRRYTDGPERNAKLYFTTENFSTDDKYFFFNKDVEGGQETYRADIATGELTRITDKAYCGFALDREKSIVLIQVEDKQYLLGVNSQSFVLLNTTDAPAQQTPPQPGGEQGGMPFQEALRKVWEARKKQGNEMDASAGE